MATVQKHSSPFPEFVSLTPTVFLYDPPSHSATAPTLLLNTWLNAASSNIQFYIRQWQSLLPTARIIVILGTMHSIVYASTHAQKRNLEPVLSVLRAEPASPLHAHLFSNAGAYNMSILLRAFKETSVDQISQLPLRSIIFDSTPSQGTYESAYTGMSWQFARSPFYTRYLGLFLIRIILVWIVIREGVFGIPNLISQLNGDLNDEALVAQGVPRLYLYSREDQLVRWDDVEYHAAIAKSKGWSVKMEIFHGSDHCRHGKGKGEERYWNACQRLVRYGSS